MTSLFVGPAILHVPSIHMSCRSPQPKFMVDTMDISITEGLLLSHVRAYVFDSQ